MQGAAKGQELETAEYKKCISCILEDSILNGEFVLMKGCYLLKYPSF